jgi:predicted GNAT family N-acyltransferase
METLILSFYDRDFQKCIAIRDKVFIEEQHVPLERERDDLDDICRHYLFSVNGKPLGTARSRIDSEKTKIERFAFLSEARGLGLGAPAFRFIVEDCIIGAQAYLHGFYERLGFAIKGDIFMDAGIEHIEMVYKNHLT